MYHHLLSFSAEVHVIWKHFKPFVVGEETVIFCVN
jgi:hypothetical protein